MLFERIHTYPRLRNLAIGLRDISKLAKLIDLEDLQELDLVIIGESAGVRWNWRSDIDEIIEEGAVAGKRDLHLKKLKITYDIPYVEVIKFIKSVEASAVTLRCTSGLEPAISAINSTVIDLALCTDADSTQHLLVTQLDRFSQLRNLTFSGSFIVAGNLFTRLLRNSSINSIILSGGFKFDVSDMLMALSIPTSATSLRSLDCEDVEDYWGPVIVDGRSIVLVDRLIRITESRAIEFSGSTLDDHLEYIAAGSSHGILSHSELHLVSDLSFDSVI
jgi:hypothetical protein